MFSFLVISFILWTSTSSLSPGDFFKTCRRNDPNLDQCIINTLNDIRPLLKTGIPQLKIQPLDPMLVTKVGLPRGSGPVSIDSTFTNLKIHGMTNYQLTKVTPNLEEYKLDFEATLPYLFNEGNYTMDGRILILPINGKGYSQGNYTGVSVTASLIGSPIEKDGKKYMKVDDFKFNLDVKFAVIQLDNLFNGNKQLGEAMNTFMKENWMDVYNELKPVVNEAISYLLKDVAFKVFDAFPLEQLFTE